MVETIVTIDPKVNSQILLDGAQEVLGLETVKIVIERFSPRQSPARADGSPSKTDVASSKIDGGCGFSSFDSSEFCGALKEIYGAPGGRGLAMRIGRATFRSLLKYYGDQAGFRSMEYRLLPSPRRVQNGLQALALLLAEQTASDIVVSEDDTSWIWRVQPSSACGENKAADQDCYLTAGLLQEFTTWAGGGRFYRVVETECRESGGSACLYRIEKKPLD
jgi:predicted hydrocarbon binding protein